MDKKLVGISLLTVGGIGLGIMGVATLPQVMLTSGLIFATQEMANIIKKS